MTKNELEEEMKSDADMEAREEYAREVKMRDELDYCIEQFSDYITEIDDAKSKLLIQLAKYGHEIGYRELEEYI